jgi:hypothetical protein
MDLSKLVQNIDVNKVNVFLVLPNVVLVLNPSINVTYVAKEELNHQNVVAQMVNSLMNLTSVEIVTLNVKLVLIMPSVLNVLMIPTD